jgi:hypothetical protein
VAVSSPPPPPDEPLFGNWVASRTSQGEKFFYNRTLDLSTWKHPATLTNKDLTALKDRALDRSLYRVPEPSSIDDQLSRVFAGQTNSSSMLQAAPHLHSNLEISGGELPVMQLQRPFPDDAPSPISSRATSSSKTMPLTPAHLTHEEVDTLVRAELRKPVDADQRRDEWQLYGTAGGGQLHRTAALRPVIDEDLSSSDEADDDDEDDETHDGTTQQLVVAAPDAPKRPTTVPSTLGREEGDVLRAALHQASLLRERLEMRPNTGMQKSLGAANKQRPPTMSLAADVAAQVASEDNETAGYRRLQPFRVVALFENIPEHAGELAFDQGDSITVIAQEGGWFEGLHDETGVVGWFSRNYCQAIDSETLQ